MPKKDHNGQVLDPDKKVVITFCFSRLCQRSGVEHVWRRACRDLGMTGEGTTADGLVTLVRSEQLGDCAYGPTVQVEVEGEKERLFERVSPLEIARLLHLHHQKKLNQEKK